MRNRRILILGGTGEARLLAQLIADAGGEPVTSLAGGTSSPARPVGSVRSGGFGGTDGLAAYVEQGSFAGIVDATHPFAVQISAHAADAARRCRIPIARLERPLWTPGPGDRWFFHADSQSAAAALGDDARVLLTLGHRDLIPFLSRPRLSGVVRMIEAPTIAFPSGWTLIRARPPFSFADELALFDREKITALVTRNSGGEDTHSKLDAARAKGIAVHLIERPRKPDIPTAASAEALLALLSSMLGA